MPHHKNPLDLTLGQAKGDNKKLQVKVTSLNLRNRRQKT
jgi:hypothetical protein